MRTYHYVAAAGGKQHAFDVQEHSQPMADLEAKLTVERWLGDNGMTPSHLDRFDFSHTTP